MKSYVIHFIRNMPCEGNLEGRYIGRTESPLAFGSISQLAGMKRQYQYPKADAFFAGPSTRCVDTLKILYPEADPEVILEMAECDFGDWENKTAKELENDPQFRLWMEGGGKTAPPNGESGLVAAQRVCKGFEILVRNLMTQGTTSAVLTVHGGAIMTLLSAYGLPRASFFDWMCEPGCGYSARITPGLWMRSMVMEVFDVLPKGRQGERPDHLVVDLAREAAKRAYGEKGQEEEKELDKREDGAYNAN